MLYNVHLAITLTSRSNLVFPLPCIYIIAQVVEFVKGEIEFFFNFFRSVTVSTASPVGRYIRATVCVPLLTLLIIADRVAFVNTFRKNNCKLFFSQKA